MCPIPRIHTSTPPPSHGSGMRLTGPFIIMIWRMIYGDICRFVLIYVSFWLAFSLATYGGQAEGVALQDIMMNNAGTFTGEMEVDKFLTVSPVLLGYTLLFTWVILSSVLLANLLIAMMVRHVPPPPHHHHPPEGAGYCLSWFGFSDFIVFKI